MERDEQEDSLRVDGATTTDLTAEVGSPEDVSDGVEDGSGGEVDLDDERQEMMISEDLENKDPPPPEEAKIEDEVSPKEKKIGMLRSVMEEQEKTEPDL